MPATSLNASVLELLITVNRCFPRPRKTGFGRNLHAVTRDVCHHALTAQLGDGDPRDLVKLALHHCGEKGVSLHDVADLVNAFQEGHSAPVKKAS